MTIKKITPPTRDTESEKKVIIHKSKKIISKSIQEETTAVWNDKVKKLTLQGEFAKILIEELTNITWKSITNNITKGVLSFALKASVNGLNTPDNLKRWGARKMDKCQICGNFTNLEHVLNWCSTSLNQGRFKWRHDSILSYMSSEMTKGKPNDTIIYIDIRGHQINGGTKQPDIATTGQRPDVAILNRKEKKIVLFELTVSFEKNADSANAKKEEILI